MELAVDQPFDLASTLESGQAHRWRREDGRSSGVVKGNFIKIGPTQRGLEFRCSPSSEEAVAPLLERYFRLDDDLNAIYAEISRDERVATRSKGAVGPVPRRL